MKVHYTDPYILDPRHKLTISVHGVGGTGSFLLSKLARLNVVLQTINNHPGLHVIAYDHDIIESHNFVRSTFSPSDSGMPKASTIITRINRYYGLKWEGVDEKRTKLNDATNIIFLCVDSLKARKDIISKTKLNGYHNTSYLYCFDVGNDTDHGQIIVSSTDNIVKNKHKNNVQKMKYSWELFDIKDTPDVPSCSMKESLSAQSVFINEAMALYTAEMFKDFILSPKLTYNSIFVNLKEISTSKTFLT